MKAEMKERLLSLKDSSAKYETIYKNRTNKPETIERPLKRSNKLQVKMLKRLIAAAHFRLLSQPIIKFSKTYVRVCVCVFGRG